MTTDPTATNGDESTIKDLLQKDPFAFELHSVTAKRLAAIRSRAPEETSELASTPRKTKNSTGPKKPDVQTDSKQAKPYPTAFTNLLESFVETHYKSSIRLIQAITTDTLYPRSNHIAALLSTCLDPDSTTSDTARQITSTFNGVVDIHGSVPFRDLWMHDDGEREFWEVMEKAKSILVDGLERGVQEKIMQGQYVMELVMRVFEADVAQHKDKPEETILAFLIGSPKRGNTIPRLKIMLDYFQQLLQVDTCTMDLMVILQRWMRELGYLALQGHMDLPSYIRNIITILSSLPEDSHPQPTTTTPPPTLQTFITTFPSPTLRTLLTEHILQSKSRYPPSTKKLAHATISMKKIVQYHLKAGPLKEDVGSVVKWVGWCGSLVGSYAQVRCVRGEKGWVVGFSEGEEGSVGELEGAVEECCRRLVGSVRGKEGKGRVEGAFVGLRMQVLGMKALKG
ncbi:hypothetical protein HDV00_002101 [Rhizophlyctis rosea]|nr:hypothetical protein HDV00_002101 [Rhizophlyctis rosea]